MLGMDCRGARGDLQQAQAPAPPFHGGRPFRARHRAVGSCRQEARQPGLAHARRLSRAPADLRQHAQRRPRTASSTAWRPTPISPSSASRWAIAASRSTAGAKATRARRPRTFCYCAKRVGDRMTLMYDAASELKTFADAIHVGKACDEGRLLLVRRPVHGRGLVTARRAPAKGARQDSAASD